MQTPDTALRTTSDQGTAVACACGATLFRLEPGQGVYPRANLSRVLADENTRRKGICQECGAEYSIPVSRWNPA